MLERCSPKPLESSRARCAIFTAARIGGFAVASLSAIARHCHAGCSTFHPPDAGRLPFDARAARSQDDRGSLSAGIGTIKRWMRQYAEEELIKPRRGYLRKLAASRA